MLGWDGYVWRLGCVFILLALNLMRLVRTWGLRKDSCFSILSNSSIYINKTIQWNYFF